MKINKLVPRNWFKREGERESAWLPARREWQGAWPEPLANLHNEIDRFFDEITRAVGLPVGGWDRLLAPIKEAEDWFKPSVEIATTENEYTVNVELPGVSEKDVTVEVTGDTLRIAGEKKQEKEEKSKDYYFTERAYGSFERLLTLPEDAEAEGINAKFKNGVLTITIPRKAQPQSEAKRIEVKTE
jgi:HSP20 family protein